MECGPFNACYCDSRKPPGGVATSAIINQKSTSKDSGTSNEIVLVPEELGVIEFNDEDPMHSSQEAGDRAPKQGSLKRGASNLSQGSGKKGAGGPTGMLKRGLSNFSVGSAGSKRSGKSTPSGGSLATGERVSTGNAPSRWSTIFGAQGFLDTMATPLKDDERMITFDESKMQGALMPASLNDRCGGRPNRIRTTKFTALTWLPKSLMYQFQRVANIYFLFIAVLVVFPWSPKGWMSKIFPFIFVLLWTACKDLFEDTRRRRDDDAENSQRCKRIRRVPATEEEEDFEEIAWSQVLAGDVLFIPEDTAFPADLMLLHPAGDTEAFISTVMLDGETSLKNRQAPSICEVISRKCAKESPEDWQVAQAALGEDGQPLAWDRLKAQILRFTKGLRRPGLEVKFCSPTPVLSDVRGTIQPRGNTEENLVCPFTEDNFLPRGCILRNTPWVLAVALYVGDDTKTRLNASTANLKFSNMQMNLNNCVRGLLAGLFSLCLFATIIAFAAQGSLAADVDNLPKDSRNPVIRFFMFCITFYHVVPMSLYVVYEMLKLVLAFQVNTDKQMVDPLTGDMAKARTAEVMEEMGQVNFLFSDKTGTLTANEMVFARCHMGGEDLGEFRKTAEGAPGAGATRVKLILEAGKEKEPLFENALNLFTCLAVCHSVQVTHKEVEGQSGATIPFYSGMSPDEVALVQVAHDVGISFHSRVRKHAGNTSELALRGPGDKGERKFTVLHELAFTSDRKRMSVIVRHKGSIWCITKGADSVMEGLLNAPFDKACSDDLSKFSKQGLRTLIVGMRTVGKEEYEAWNSEYTAARNIIDETKEGKMAEVGAKLEKGLKFIGVTAVEDRLQDGVPDAISTVKDMGIRLWVLTGDKTETAVDIARSCQLFSETTTLAYATQGDSPKDAEDKLLKAHSKLDGQTDGGLVLDGQTLLHTLSNPECRKIIYELGVVSRSCICARLSPMQKLELVKLVREQNLRAITLAIGDGANDVPMIQGAHLGIAIRGKEGTQAVQASDIAISYFRFLVPLLLCHGRRAYRRVALFLCFYLYKNVALLMCDVWWMFQDKFRARIALPEYLSINFNVLFSAWHLLFVIGFDKDIADSLACLKPELYRVGPCRSLFNMRIFMKWIAVGVLQGSLCWTLPHYWVGSSDYEKTVPGDFWVGSTVSFTAVNVVVWLKLVIWSQNPLSKMTLLPTAGAACMYLMALFMIGYTPPGKIFQPCMWHIPQQMGTNMNALMALVVTCVVALSVDVVEKLSVYFLCPSPLQIAQRGS